MEVRAESKGLVEFKDDRVFYMAHPGCKGVPCCNFCYGWAAFLFVCGRCPT